MALQQLATCTLFVRIAKNLFEISMNASTYSDTQSIPPNFANLMDKAAGLPVDVQEEMILQWLDDIENELQWQKTLEQPQPKLEQLALAALQQSHQGKTFKKGFDEL